MDRIAQIVRRISDRHYLDFIHRAQLAQAQTRYLAAFSSQSREAFEAAIRITFFPELGDGYYTDDSVVPPDGERLAGERDSRDVQPLRRDFDPEQLPDVETRKVTPAFDPAERNGPGSFERLTSMGMGTPHG